MLPSVLYLAIIIFGIGIVATKHGQPGVNIWATLAGQAVTLPLLAWGGFFDTFLRAIGF